MRTQTIDFGLSAALLLLSIGFTHAMNNCFKTDDYDAVRGRPQVLTWQDDHTEYDIGFATTDKDFIGYVNRNITDTSLVWVPPFNVTDGPFRYALYVLGRGSVCYSPEFNISGDSNGNEYIFDAQKITTTVTINQAISTVTATVAYFTPDAQVLAGDDEATASVSASEITVTDDIRATGRATQSQSTATGNDAPDDGDNNYVEDHGAEIGVGVAFGVLGLAVLVLGALLWRSRRKQRRIQDEKKKLDAEAVDTTTATPASGFSELQGGVDGPTEMATRENAPEIDGCEKPAEVADVGTYAPVELPAEDVSEEWQRAVRIHQRTESHEEDLPRYEDRQKDPLAG